MALEWKLDFDGGPIYLQIAAEVQRLLARGDLKAGDKLPSARELGQAIGVNPNTVVHAFGELETLGISETRRGLGTFVREDAPIENLRAKLLGEAARRYLEEARGLGLSAERAIGILEEVSHDSAT